MAGSFLRCRCAGVSVISTSRVGRTMPANRWPASAAPSEHDRWTPLPPMQRPSGHARDPPWRHMVCYNHTFTNHNAAHNLCARQGLLGSPQCLQDKPRQSLSSKPVAALAAGLPRPDRLGLGNRAHDADRGAQMRQVGPKLVERSLAGDGLAGRLGALPGWPGRTSLVPDMFVLLPNSAGRTTGRSIYLSDMRLGEFAPKWRAGTPPESVWLPDQGVPPNRGRG